MLQQKDLCRGSDRGLSRVDGVRLKFQVSHQGPYFSLMHVTPQRSFVANEGDSISISLSSTQQIATRSCGTEVTHSGCREMNEMSDISMAMLAMFLIAVTLAGGQLYLAPI